MAVEVKVRRVGTSLGVIIPKEKLEELAVKKGDTIVLRRIEKPAREIRGILKGTGFVFEREFQDRSEPIHGTDKARRQPTR